MDEDCSIETELSDSIVLQSVRWLQIFVALAAILLVTFIVCRHLTQTILDSVTIVSYAACCEMFLRIIFMNSAVYSIGIGVTQVRKQIRPKI
ncbi:hypothetical protein PRIPAC_97903 [Pristionchus pacificus]|uniref:Uncharacterized protein n=1 Tax=Pristionchus pacificus TaxID=54126 RepID=A0A2A6D1L7_PRIPA|nr:hypothetical protein PRIPAC_97903 [Pristionchus pacificus]|eukprot:PDM84279.1 hypothetical protein PRIPAC_33302 [Pristionchus pacificus]